MSAIQSDLVIRKMPWHANMTELNHLGAALIAKPERLQGTMMKLFTAYRYSDNPLSAMLGLTGKVKTINKSEWEWDLRTATTRPAVILENVLPGSVTQPGKSRTIFDVKWDTNFWKPGDVMHPGTSDKRYQVRIQDHPRRHGNGWIYRVRLMADGIDAYLPLKFLAPGTQWAKLFSQYEEGGQQSGSTQYSLPMSLASRMSRYRKEYQVTGDAANEVLAVKIPDSSGKLHDSWIKYAEVEYWEQWYRELERGYWYSRSTNTVLGANGRPIYSGPGIQELLEKSNRHAYSHLTTRLIEEYLMDVFYSRIAPGSGREIVGFTGEYGMIQFHRAVTEDMQKKGFITVDSYFIQDEKSPYHSNAKSYGFQFVKYKMANGASLRLVHQPLYDDREINFEIDPVTGYPVESMRYTFLDMSGEGTSSNIALMKKSNEFKLGYVHGLQTPYGPVNNKGMAHSGDYYEMHVVDRCGVHIEDTSRCGELILKRNV